jgi:hypothetical protein
MPFSRAECGHSPLCGIPARAPSRASTHQGTDGGLQVGRVYINTNSIFRIGDSQMQLTSAGKMTISTVITDATTGSQSMETDYAKLQSWRI